MKESSYSKGIIDFHITPLGSNKLCKKEDMIEKPFFQESFFSRFFCLFCIYKPNHSISQNKQDTDKKKYITNFSYEEYPNHIKIVNSMKNNEELCKEKNQLEGSHYSNITLNSKKDPLNAKKSNKQFENSFTHNQCFFLSYQEKYIVLSRIQNKKFYIEEKYSLSHNPETFNDYLAQRLKKFCTILQFGANSSKQIGKLAKYCEVLYVLDSNVHGLAQIKSKFYNSNVEVFQSNNFKCLHNTFLEMDLIFINPIWKTLKNNSQNVGFDHLEPNLGDLLSQALSLTQNVVISLPIYVNLNEIAKIMWELTDKKLIKDGRNSIEFEFVYFNKKLAKILMFLGNSNTISHEESLDFYSKYLHENFKSEDQTQEYQELISFLNWKLGFNKLCEVIPMIKKKTLKNESTSLLQKLLDNLIENSLISKEEILEFLHDKPQNVYATISSCFKESYDLGLACNYEESGVKLKKKNSCKSKLCKNSTKKIKKTIDAGHFSSYSNYSGFLFDEFSSLDIDHIKQTNDHEGLMKIEEGNSNYNSSSLKNMNMDKGFFRENGHETYG